MPLVDLQLPTRLLAGGGPASPDRRVLQALTTPLIGQFDPDFTAIMDDIVHLSQETFLTANPRTFAVSGAGSAGLEAVLNSLIEDGDRVAIGGGPAFVASTAEIAQRCGATLVSIDALMSATKLLVVPHIDPTLGMHLPLRDMASAAHTHGTRVIVDATLSAAATELRVDDWAIDVCVAVVDHAIGAPSGMALVTYSAEVETQLLMSRRTPPPTSFLDLQQLQAYWSPERLNHHTAPTTLVYGLREALRLVLEEGLQQRWQRHQEIGIALRRGLEALGLDVEGDPPYAIVRFPGTFDEDRARRQLLEQFGVYVKHIGPHTWRVALLAADATPEAVQRVLIAVEKVVSAA